MSWKCEDYWCKNSCCKYIEKRHPSLWCSHARLCTTARRRHAPHAAGGAGGVRAGDTQAPRQPQ